MQKLIQRQVVIFLVGLPLVVFVLSWLFDVPYLISVFGILAWATLGHLVTLDDDIPGGWSNAEGSRRLWLLSLVGLAAKITLLLVLFWLVGQYPQLKEYGA